MVLVCKMLVVIFTFFFIHMTILKLHISVVWIKYNFFVGHFIIKFDMIVMIRTAMYQVWRCLRLTKYFWEHIVLRNQITLKLSCRSWESRPSGCCQTGLPSPSWSSPMWCSWASSRWRQGQHWRKLNLCLKSMKTLLKLLQMADGLPARNQLLYIL